MSLVDDIRKGLGARANHRAISVQLANIELQLERIANAFEVFSKAAENDLAEAADKTVRRRTSKLTIGTLDQDAANAAYRENTTAKGTPPPPDNDNYEGGPA